MGQLPLTNIVTIAVSQSNPGAGAYNTSNLALFTDDAPAASVQTISFSAVSASGNFTLSFGGNATASIAWNASVAAIQAAINAVTGMSNVIVSGSIAGQVLTLQQPGVFGAIILAVVSANSLQTSAPAAITVTPAITAAGWSGGSLGYAAYASPNQVASDFGSSSKTYEMANAVFSQQPNILTGGGQLIIILMKVSVWNLAFSGIAASGTFVVTYNGNSSAAINWDDSSIAIQAKIQAVPGLSQVQVTGNIINLSLNIALRGVYGAGLAVTTGSDTLATSAPAAITIAVTNPTVGNTIGAQVSASLAIVQFFGVLINESCGTGQVIPTADAQALAAILLPLLKIGFLVTNSQSDLTAVSGIVAVMTAASFTNTRWLYYGDTSSVGVANALVMAASYAGLALSTNFNGSNTTTVLHLKVLNGVSPDPSMSQTILNLAVSVGADIYVSLQGVPAVFTSGANSYYDQVYNLLWFQGALQIAGFNYLAQTGTKIPQTEVGMDGLKNAYRAVCNQAVTNGYCAPGTWNSATVFGNTAQMLLNIAQVGYYIYSQPVAQQLQTARAARQAPLVQIALKQAGGIQSSSVIIAINA